MFFKRIKKIHKLLVQKRENDSEKIFLNTLSILILSLTSVILLSFTMEPLLNMYAVSSEKIAGILIKISYILFAIFFLIVRQAAKKLMGFELTTNFYLPLIATATIPIAWLISYLFWKYVSIFSFDKYFNNNE